jgi:low affinity Fe/Cu permease
MVKELKSLGSLEKLSMKATDWVGTPQSVLVHTLFFIGIFVLSLFGLTLDKILLILTTAVSLEAIYLAIFIQMTVNRNTRSLEEVEEDIDEIQEDVEGLESDIDEISEDVEDITEDMAEDDTVDQRTHSALKKIQDDLARLQEDLAKYKKIS